MRAAAVLGRNRALAAGLALTAAFVALALLSCVWTPGDPFRIRIGARLLGPLRDGLLGTDQFGRDVASLVMIGARNTLLIAWPAVMVGALAGILLGSLAASRRGLLDELVMRACDIAFAFPALLVAVMLGASLGEGPLAAVWAIALFNVPVFARVTRGAARQAWAMDYVLAARAVGKTRWAIAMQDVLPNIAGVIVIQLMVQLAVAIVMEAGFSYVGIGLAPPAPSWGRMLREAQTFIHGAPHLVLAPGIAIALSVLGLNLLGDGLKEIFDPSNYRHRTHPK